LQSEAPVELVAAFTRENRLHRTPGRSDPKSADSVPCYPFPRT
jgi:hypothetical protein